jgi:hypothetical protein
MATKLLAVVLTLLLGSPVCWCCITHAEPAAVAQDETPACPMCASQAPENSAPAEKSGCHCESACSAREITQPTVAVPAATQTNLPPDLWVWANSSLHAAPRFVAASEFVVHETGPPRPAGALYLMHCALLN